MKIGVVNTLSVFITVKKNFKKKSGLGWSGYPIVPVGVHEICPKPKLSRSM